LVGCIHIYPPLSFVTLHDTTHMTVSSFSINVSYICLRGTLVLLGSEMGKRIYCQIPLGTYTDWKQVMVLSVTTV